MPGYDWLKDTHPVWDAHHEEWARRERLLRGGTDVIEEELPPFSWETKDDDSHKKRKREAVYPGFGESFLRTLIGHVLRDRPEAGGALSFGGMGEIERSETQENPSQAELVFYNVNGTGGDGQQLWQWVASVMQRAGATGMRWVMVEAPTDRPVTEEDEINGLRPYAVEFSPRVVTNWKIQRGTLQWCVVKIRSDTRRIEGGEMKGKANEEGYYLLVRQGYQGLGSEFTGGGWWKFDGELKAPLAQGTWEKTGGEIPMAFAIWEWEAEPAGDDALALARGATTALDNLSVGYMNLKSAWRSNGWRSAGAPDYMLGVDGESWPLTRQQYEQGSGLIGVPKSRDGANPSIAHGSAAVVSSEAFGTLLKDMTEEAERMMVQLATSTPDSSGRSKEAGFAESKGPRLTMLAENIESFLNTLLRFFEMRFGHARTGAYVEMPRDFDLAPVEQDIRDFFDTFRRSMLRSATLETEAMLKLAESKGLVNDENRDLVRDELTESAAASMAAGTQEGGFFGGLFGGTGGGGDEEGGEE